jgi:hypothetical protein
LAGRAIPEQKAKFQDRLEAMGRGSGFCRGRVIRWARTLSIIRPALFSVAHELIINIIRYSELIPDISNKVAPHLTSSLHLNTVLHRLEWDIIETAIVNT